MKRVPRGEEFESSLTALALAIWIQDDGSFMMPNGLKLATHGFTYDDVQYLVGVLNHKYGLSCYSQRHEAGKDQYAIRVPPFGMEKLIALVLPYMVDSMLYKLGLGPLMEARIASITAKNKVAVSENNAETASSKAEYYSREGLTPYTRQGKIERLELLAVDDKATAPEALAALVNAGGVMDKSGALMLHTAVCPEETVAQLALAISNRYSGVLCTKHKSPMKGYFKLHVRKQSVGALFGELKPHLNAGIAGHIQTELAFWESMVAVKGKKTRNTVHLDRPHPSLRLVGKAE